MRKEGFVEDADRLSTATVHWLRHTGISDDVKHRPREHVRDDAGHGSSAITDRYIDVERAERHATARHKQMRWTRRISLDQAILKITENYFYQYPI